MKQRYIILSICYICVLLLSCSDNNDNSSGNILLLDNEKKAEAIMEKANILWMKGYEIKALKLYEKIAKHFPSTKARKKTEKRLLRFGFSLGSSLSSWTAKRLINFENRMVDHFFKTGQYPLENEIEPPLDAWNNPIYFKITPYKKDYDFIVSSMGPDQIKNTDDDISLVHRKEDISYVERIMHNNQIVNDKTVNKDSLALEQLKKTSADKGQDNSTSEDMELNLDEIRNLAR